MPILGVIASSYLQSTDAGAFVPIATTTLASSAASITFSSIPATYTHLQIRGVSRCTTSGLGSDWIYMRFNSDTGSNYSRHQMYGNGVSIVLGAEANITFTRAGITPRDGNTANVMGANIIDVLDYTNTNKYKTVRTLFGDDFNGSGELGIQSGLWMNTNAVTSITLFPESNSWKQYTQFSLYGIKG